MVAPVVESPPSSWRASVSWQFKESGILYVSTVWGSDFGAGGIWYLYTYKYVNTVYQKSLLIEKNDVHSQNAQPVSQPHLQRLIVLIGHFSAGLLGICLMYPKSPLGRWGWSCFFFCQVVLHM